MGKRQINKSRRAILNTILGLGALGATLPSRWTKPIVSAVVLPAHAQTSGSFSVTKTQSGGPNPVMVEGDVIEYAIVVSNTGSIPLTGVVATDTLPDGSVVILSGQTESMSANGILDVGETWTYATTYTVSLDDVLSGDDLTNTVSVVTNEVPDPQDDEVDTPVVPVVCPTVEVGGVLRSNAASNGLCSLSFEFFSASTTPLTITAISNTALTATSSVTYDDSFPIDVTDSIGTRVTWTGGVLDANCAIDFTLLADDVTFTVEATCEGAAEPISVDFAMSSIGAMS